MDEELAGAIARLEEFAGTYDVIDIVDGDGKLTAGDILLVVTAAKRGASVVELGSLHAHSKQHGQHGP